MAGKKKLKIAAQLGLTARASRTALSANLAGLGLFPGQDAVLLALEDEGMTLRGLADHLQVKPPTITKTIARLSARRLVEKRPSPTDARQSLAHLTEEGRQLVERIRLAQSEVAERALAGMKKKDRARLQKLLKRMERNLGTPPEPPAELDQAAGG